MYNKKYCLTQITELRKPNPMHEAILNTICYLAYLNPGEQGWFLSEMEDIFCGVHRIHTSTVRSVEYNNPEIIVTTENTTYVFTEI